jgi:signal transduction histidine kinase
MGDTPAMPGARLAAAIATTDWRPAAASIDWGPIATAVVSELGTPLARIEGMLEAMREEQQQMRAAQQQMQASISGVREVQDQMRVEQRQMRNALVTLARSQSFSPPKIQISRL